MTARTNDGSTGVPAADGAWTVKPQVCALQPSTGWQVDLIPETPDALWDSSSEGASPSWSSGSSPAWTSSAVESITPSSDYDYTSDYISDGSEWADVEDYPGYDLHMHAKMLDAGSGKDLAWRADSIGSGSGYSRPAKRFAATILPLVAVVSVAVNLLLLLRGQSDAMDGAATRDSAQPSATVQCGRTIEQYMFDIDRACCGDATDESSVEWCSSITSILVDSERNTTKHENAHSLYVCTTRCAEVVLPLWSQCIQPELLTQYPSIEESPAWLFQPVVAKCSQPAARRNRCVDDDSVTDPFSFNFLQSSSQSSDAPRSLCRELRAGLLECDDLLGSDGRHSNEYPTGWYDGACCRSCPAFWPRALLDEMRHGCSSCLDPELLASKPTLQALEAAMEREQQADLNGTFPSIGPAVPLARVGTAGDMDMGVRGDAPAPAVEVAFSPKKDTSDSKTLTQQI